MQQSKAMAGTAPTSLPEMSFLFSSTLMLLRRSTQPGLISGWATNTLNLHVRDASLSISPAKRCELGTGCPYSHCLELQRLSVGDVCKGSDKEQAGTVLLEQ